VNTAIRSAQGVRDTDRGPVQRIRVGGTRIWSKPGEEPRVSRTSLRRGWRGKLAMEINEVDWYASLTTYWLEHGRPSSRSTSLQCDQPSTPKSPRATPPPANCSAPASTAWFISAYTQNIDTPAAKGAPSRGVPPAGSQLADHAASQRDCPRNEARIASRAASCSPTFCSRRAEGAQERQRIPRLPPKRPLAGWS